MQFSKFRDQILEEENLFLAFTEEELLEIYNFFILKKGDFFTAHILFGNKFSDKHFEMVTKQNFFLTLFALTHQNKAFEGVEVSDKQIVNLPSRLADFALQ